ncbi:unnamed protein product [Malus baccata var. baccata]
MAIRYGSCEDRPTTKARKSHEQNWVYSRCGASVAAWKLANEELTRGPRVLASEEIKQKLGLTTVKSLLPMEQSLQKMLCHDIDGPI